MHNAWAVLLVYGILKKASGGITVRGKTLPQVREMILCIHYKTCTCIV